MGLFIPSSCSAKCNIWFLLVQTHKYRKEIHNIYKYDPPTTSMSNKIVERDHIVEVLTAITPGLPSLLAFSNSYKYQTHLAPFTIALPANFCFLVECIEVSYISYFSIQLPREVHHWLYSRPSRYSPCKCQVAQVCYSSML